MAEPRRLTGSPDSGDDSLEAASRQDHGPAIEGIAGYLEDAAQAEFDRLVSGRVRIGMLSALAVNRRMSFSELKDLLATTDGNLSVHARKLEDAGYVRCSKTFDGRLPKTTYELTSAGSQALKRYLDHMEALIAATRGR